MRLRNVDLRTEDVEIRPNLTVTDVVLAGQDGSLVPWWQEHSDEDRDQAAALAPAYPYGRWPCPAGTSSSSCPRAGRSG